jgi:prepilin-type N-terminal cleavage/methylation domain-containing protein
MNYGRISLRRGFTLVELLAVVATIGVLAALLLPVLGRAKIKAQRTQCLSNLRQLGYSWTLYSHDNSCWLVPSYPDQHQGAWVQGDVSRLADALNADLIRQGKLFPYNPSIAIYRCPADAGVTTLEGKKVTAVRSFSMNSFMGARDPKLGAIPANAVKYVPFFSKESDIPKPSDLWVLIDEDERSINDGFFVTDPEARVWIDFPAASAHRHAYSYELNFADGHSESWRHSDPRTMRLNKHKTEQASNADLKRLATATTVLK